MKHIYYSIMLISVLAATVTAMPYNPGPSDHPDYHLNLSRRVPEPQLPEPDRPAPSGAKAPGDTVRGIVLLIDFPDMPADTAHRGVRYQQMLFDGPWPYGTMTEYFREVSYNQFTVTGTVDTIWYHAAHNHDYYGYTNGTGRAAALVKEAVLAANAVVDFSRYDNNGDGQVDGLFVIHAGPGREEGSAGDTNIHSHKSYLSSWVGAVSADGVTVDMYSIEPEEHYYASFSVGYNSIISKGVFCHEFGHVIGLPDLYDTDYSSQGIGDYCLMAGGSWGGNDQTPYLPVHPCAWIKQRVTSMKRAWITPTAVATNQYGKLLPPVETSPSLFKLWKNGVYGQQYFLVENRQRIGHDLQLPNDGLLIWHIDESRPNNNTESRKLVDLECATGLVYGGGTKDHLDTTLVSYDYNDYWCPATGKTAFDPFTSPSSKDYSNALTMCAVYNIAQADGDTIRLDLFVGGSNLNLSGIRLNDATGDGDSIPEENEIVGLAVTLVNTTGWANATGVTARLSTADTSIQITDSLAVFPNINAGASGTCSADSFVFYVKPGTFPHNVRFILTKVCTQGSYDRVDTVVVPVGRPRVLLVDDDNGDSYENWYQRPLDTLDILFTTWSVSSRGPVPADTLLQYPVMVWLTGNDSTTTLTGSDTTNIKLYLDAGNKLFISSKQLGDLLGASGFYANYLRASFISDNANRRLLRGVAGNPVGQAVGDTVAIGYSGGASNYGSCDAILPLPGADTCFMYQGLSSAGAVSYQGSYKLVYFAFPFEGISGAAPRYEQRLTIMRRIMDWFGGVMPTGVENESWTGSRVQLPPTLWQNNPNPFNSNTAIRFQLDRPARVRLVVYNMLGQQVRILEDGLLSAGVHVTDWNGTGQQGRRLTNGVYFFQLETAEQRLAVRKVVLLR